MKEITRRDFIKTVAIGGASLSLGSAVFYKPLEAMASGKPVIISDIPGVREVIVDKKEGLLTPPMDIKEMANKIKKLLDHPKLRKQMGKAGRKKVVEKFEIAKVVDQLEEVYKNSLKKD